MGFNPHRDPQRPRNRDRCLKREPAPWRGGLCIFTEAAGCGTLPLTRRKSLRFEPGRLHTINGRVSAEQPVSTRNAGTISSAV